MSFAAVQPDARLTGKLINPLLSSVINTFAMMLDSRVERGAVDLRNEHDAFSDVTAMIRISGGAKGLVCISFPEKTALQVVDRFLGESYKAITLETLDALGELVNMVGGAAKSKLNMGLNIGLPNVVNDSEHQIEFPANSKPMRVHFDSDIGSFFVDFGFVVRNL
ncbi:hypothetical protein MalM25_13610 [Planctomycetes bacterium MalM25]|nr:hypothetical protein MalM25_13610 [Planctomycetes bacterium MalM25]